MLKNNLKIALVGNPNCGKSSLFNALTGLNQKVGNFPGVTVDKKSGKTTISPNITAEVIDLPGAYSIYPRREDEWTVYNVLMGIDKEDLPDIIVLIADASNLKRNLLFASQIIDLKFPVVVALTMVDIARKNGIEINIPALEIELGVPVVAINPRKNRGIQQLKKTIELVAGKAQNTPPRDFIDIASIGGEAIGHARFLSGDGSSDYKSSLELIHASSEDNHSPNKEAYKKIAKDTGFNPTKFQAEEILQRYTRIGHILKQSVTEPSPLQKSLFTEKLDNILLHRVWGYLILFFVLFLLFQSVYMIAEYPMLAIEGIFAFLIDWLGEVLPEAWWSDLLVNGILAGLGGIVVFIPQIMILFGLITILEDTGYMARISFLSDKLMRKCGLNGKSVMPMISGFACAVPAVMSARSIENRKERLLTILVTPLLSCSARLPVYTILIGLVIPKEFVFGIFSLQGLVMLALYLLGTTFALLIAYIAKWFIKNRDKSYFILELPVYRSPRWKSILNTMVEKAKIFVTEAGKVIMVISIILWASSSFGPKERMQAVHEKYDRAIAANPGNADELNKEKNAELLANSYSGLLGKALEPAIEPLGYDWKIGIALLTSFAAREVFVGTMATLYSVEDDGEENFMLREKMAAATREDGSKIYSLATGLSLMVFYVFAMQCMSTLAIVKRETRSWKWPVIQFVYMTALAYVMSLIVYNLFN